jgi:hypothetical protein
MPSPSATRRIVRGVISQDFSLDATELGYINGVTAGTVTASKAVVVSADKDVASLRNLTLTNLDAGASGTAGSVDIFPATAAKGKLIISATDNATNHNVTLTNASTNGASVTVTIPALTGYAALSTAALTLAEVDVLDAVTPGTVAASKAVVVDSNKDIGDFRNLDAVNIDAGSDAVAGTIDVFPATTASGKLSISVTDQTGDTTVSLVVGAMAGARTITLPDPGGAASIVHTGTAAQTIAGDLTISGTLTNSAYTQSATLVQINPADEDDELAIKIGSSFRVWRFHQTITLATDGETTAVGLTPAGPILSAAIRVSTAIAGLDEADHHIQLGVAGTTDKYIDVANGSSATSIALNTKDSYVFDPADAPEAAALILTITGGSDVTPSSGAVEVEVIYMAANDLDNPA